jgi:ADP-heptose:LPS heptosyltransferase/SAM-dependent methyltransferase
MFQLNGINELAESNSTLEDFLLMLRPKKIIQTGIKHSNGIETVLRIARHLRQHETEDYLFYAIASNPQCYLDTIQALRENGLLRQVQVLVGATLSYDELLRLTEGKAVNTQFKYLPERILYNCLNDMEDAADLIVFGSDAPILSAEAAEALRALKISSHFLMLSPPNSLSQIRSEFPKEAAGLVPLDSSIDPSGILVAANPIRPGGRSGKALSAAKKQIAIVLTEHMGDIVACEPVARYIRRIEPNSNITWVVNEKYRELVENNPYLDEVLSVNCLTEWALLSKSGIYDKIIDLHINKRECPECSLEFQKWKTRRDVTLENYYHHGPLLSVFSSCAGLPPLNEAPQVYIPDTVRSEVDSLSLPEPFIVFHCSSNEYSRDWADEKWRELAKNLINAWDGAIIEIGTQACLAGSGESRIINLCGKLSILESAEVIRRAHVFAGIDSGPAHIANAVGTNGVILLGEYRAFKCYVPFTGDYSAGKRATIIYADAGPARNISVQQVLSAILKEFGRADSPKSRINGVVDNSKTGGRALEESTPPTRLIAFHLPQFHPIPENDLWWGKGFTEWRNVTRGMPLFEGHYQPQLPGELGFYDMRLPDILAQQAELAKAAGIEGFCFWHYWFEGKLLLERPIEQMIQSGKPDYPFCFAWANENWTRRWDGQDSEILMKQSYGGADDAELHFNWLVHAFQDPRYIRIEGRPVFLIYRPFDIPDVSSTIDIWTQMARRHGLKSPFMIAIRTNFDGYAPLHSLRSGFQAELIFQPNSAGSYQRIQEVLKEKLDAFPQFYSEENRVLKMKGATVCDYGEAWPIFAECGPCNDSSYGCVVPSWDNTARRANYGAFVLHNSTPTAYESWLRYEFAKSRETAPGNRILFINAWNEWAEGNHLEPDLKHANGYLEATKRAIEKSRRLNGNALDILRQAKAISRIHPLIRKIAETVHKKETNLPSTDTSINDPSILTRIQEILSAAAGRGRVGTRKNYVLIETVKELLKAYNAIPLLTYIYNCASELAVKESKEQARLLFLILAEATVQSFPELCGKSYYKLALLANGKESAIRLLKKCLQLYPEHRAAGELLGELSLGAAKGAHVSETSGLRKEVLTYCQGNGLDIGYGGDPVVPTAITIDQPPPYTPHLGSHPQNLRGDGANLYWFKDDAFDYIYSSHLIEDFAETGPVLKEWVRVLKPGGYMVLVAPVERIYREHCSRTGQEYNTNHKILEMSAPYILSQLDKLAIPYRIEKRFDLINTYSFLLVIEKI